MKRREYDNKGKNFGFDLNLEKRIDSIDELIECSLKRIEFTLHDETIKKTRRLLVKEQFRNPRVAELATRHTIDGIQKMYEKIFEVMMEDGIIVKEDPRMLAMSFTAPISLLIYVCDREPEKEPEVMEQIKEFIYYTSKKLVKGDKGGV